jgi:hypothetical protein
MPKLRIRLSGGTGNQLFQICAGLAAAKKFKQNPIFYMSRVNNSHNSDLGQHLSVDFSSGNIFTNSKLYDYYLRAINKILLKSTIFRFFSKIHKEKEIGFCPAILQKPFKELRSLYQTYRYEIEYGMPLRSMLVDEGTTEWFRVTGEVIKDHDSVAIHIRRGDYSKVSDLNGLLSADYYFNCINRLIKRFPKSDLTFFVFSDDLEFAREQFNPLKIKVIFIEPPNQSCPMESLLLMALCRRHIIANSTFSWWGANLADESELVLAPIPWMKNGSQPKDLYPGKWELVESSWE